ncbi:MAG: alpha/beta fold hydrolase [Anaerolineales bacterium]|nr:alpha/beta fold hydrolase [Anaerolineales bacterium]MCB0015873.1 alpha/beta fold hydrolase [Anaerolineales bacterium]MCB8958761.1 alpha/beta fold hydrolase [Ardenticatenales bacterium]
MPVIETNGIEVYYEIAGTGPPLLLISGMAYDHWEWHLLAPLLAAQFTVIQMDNRGSGQSSKPAGPYSAPMLAADTAGLLDHLALGPVAVLGHSMGGFVAQQLWLDRPDLISHLILASTNFGGPNHVPITQQALAVMMDISQDPVTQLRNGVALAAAPGFVERQPERFESIIAYRLTGPVPPAAYQAQLGVGLGLVDPAKAFERHLPSVTVPTLVLFGEHDLVVPPANAELFANLIPDCQVAILPDTGHIFPLEEPAAAAAVISEFLHAR